MKRDLHSENPERSHMNMKSITQEELEHLGDPIAQLVWRLWIKKGEARLETPAGNRTGHNGSL